MARPATPAHRERPGEASPFLRLQLAAVPMLEDEPDDDDLEQPLPTKVSVLPWGKVELRDAWFRETYCDEPGELFVNERSAAEIPRNFAARDIDCSINARHDYGGQAYAWIKGVEVDPVRGVVLEVEWTDLGAEAVRNKRYRYLSSECVMDASAWNLGTGPAVVVAITGAGLTNNPAVVGKEPITAYQTIGAALAGRDGHALAGGAKTPPDTTGEKGVQSMDGTFFKGLFSRIAGREPKDELDAATAAVEVTSSLASLRGLQEQVGELTAQLAAKDQELEAGKLKLREALDELGTKRAALEQVEREAAEALAVLAVDQALPGSGHANAGKIALSMRDWALGYARADMTGFAAYLEKVEAGKFSAPTGQLTAPKPNEPNASGDTREAMAARVVTFQQRTNEERIKAGQPPLSYEEAFVQMSAADKRKGA